MSAEKTSEVVKGLGIADALRDAVLATVDEVVPLAKEGAIELGKQIGRDAALIFTDRLIQSGDPIAVTLGSILAQALAGLVNFGGVSQGEGK